MTARTLMLVGFVALALPGVLLIFWARGQSSALLERPIPISEAAPAQPEHVSVTRGERLVRHVLDCGGCHGEDLGGLKVSEDWFLGGFYAPNLTRGPGGVGEALDPDAWERAIRHGVDTAGRPLLHMPSERWAALSDQDLWNVLAYLQTVPEVDREMLDSKVGPLYRLLLATGDIELPARRIEHEARRPHVTPGPTVAYGTYLATIAGCLDCHGADLRGGPSPSGLPAAPPINRRALEGWTSTDLTKVLRQGVSPSGRGLDPYMPWPAYSGMTEEEIEALWMFLWVGGG